MVERDIFEVANQLHGYIDEGTPEGLARFLRREGDEACNLAKQIVALKAENERLQRLDAASESTFVAWRSRAIAAERALAERAGGVKVRELLDEGLEILNGIIDNVKRRGNYSPESTCVFIDQAGQCLREALSALTTEPAAPEGRQDDEPRAYIVHAPEDDYYGTGPDRLQFHPLAQHDMDNGYRQTPLYGRPAHELSENTGELIDKMAEAIRGDTTSDDTPWATLSEDRKIGWRGDAERALAVVKEYLTVRRPSEQAVTDEMVEAAVRAVKYHLYNNGDGKASFIRECDIRAAIRAAIKAAMEAGR